MKTRKLLKIATLSAAVIILSIMILYSLTVTSLGENLIKGWLEETIAESAGCPTRIADFETNLFSRVRLNRIYILSPDSIDIPADTLLYINDIAVDYSLLDLIFSPMTINSITIDSMILRASRDAQGRLGIPALNNQAQSSDTAETAAASSLDIVISNASVGHIDARFNDAPYKIAASMRNGHISFEQSALDNMLIAIGIDTITANYDSLSITMTGFSLNAERQGDSIVVRDMSGKIEDLEMTASANLSGPDFNNLAARLDLSGSPQSFFNKLTPAIAAQAISQADSLSIRIEASGKLDDPAIETQIRLPHCQVSGVDFGDIILFAQLAADTLTIDSVSATCFGGSIHGSGYTLLDTSFASNLEFTVADLQATQLWQLMQGTPSVYSARLGGTIKLTGAGSDIANWDVNGSINADKISYDDRRIADLIIGFTARSGMTTLHLTQDNIVIDADVSFQDESISGQYRLTIPDIGPLALLANQPEISGRIDASGRIEGSLQSPDITALLSGQRLAYQGLPIKQVTGAMHYRDSSLYIDSLALSGQWNSDTDPVIFHQDSLSGNMRYTADIAGSTDNLRGSLSLFMAQPAYGQYNLDSAEVIAIVDGQIVDITALNAWRDNLILLGSGRYDLKSEMGDIAAHLQARTEAIDSSGDVESRTISWMPAGEIAADFSVPSDSAASMTAIINNLQIGHFSSFLPDSLPVSGLLSATTAMTGTIEHPTVAASMILRSLSVPETELDSIFFHGSFAGNELRVDTAAVFGYKQQAVLAGLVYFDKDSTGAFTLTSASRVSGTLQSENIDLGFVGPFLPDGTEIEGLASMDLLWSGTLGSPDLSGSLRLENGRYRPTAASPPIDSIDFAMSIADTVFSLTTAKAIIESTPVSMAGNLMYSDRATLVSALKMSIGDLTALSIDGNVSKQALDLALTVNRFDLSILRPFAPMVDSLDGRISSNLRITGTPELPELNGYISVDSLAAISKAFFTKVLNGRGRIDFDLNTIRVDSMSADINGGKAFLNGAITHDKLTPTDINLSLSADSMTFIDPAMYTIKVESVRLTYKKDDNRYKLSGDIKLGETKFIAGLQVQSILPWARSIETVETEMPEFIEQTKLDVRVQESNNLWIDNNLARMRLHAELGVIGSVISPNFSGLVSIEEGYLLYLDRKFKISEGTVYFTDPMKFNPDIILTAATQVSSYQNLTATKYTITFSAKGPLDQLQIALTSDPPLDQPDIVALLTLGATREQLAGKNGENSSGTTDLLLNRAAMISSSRISNFVSDKMGSMFGFNEFTVQGNLFKFDESWGPQLLASKQISKNIEVTYITTVGRLNDQTIRLGYRLTPRFSIQGQTDRDGNSLVDFKYGFQFR